MKKLLLVPFISTTLLSCGVINLPSSNLPDINLPDINLPDISMPDISMPDVSMPDISKPSLEAPKTQMLSVFSRNPKDETCDASDYQNIVGRTASQAFDQISSEKTAVKNNVVYIGGFTPANQLPTGKLVIQFSTSEASQALTQGGIVTRVFCS